MLVKLIGAGIFFFGFWFIGQNIIFTSRFSLFTLRGISASGSIILLVSGILIYVFGEKDSKNAGIIMLGLAAILIFMSGAIIIKPTSLAEVFIGIAAMIVGGRMITSGRYDI